ncbi:MAG: tetratricopeptide repeat protein, partial [Planctomycetota bacterium]|nr:tetratricopeptide repeat protein [Planctomycetota bacterium]
PVAVQSLILKMTAKSPELRHASADDLLRDINLVIQHLKTGKPIKLSVPKISDSIYVGQNKPDAKRMSWVFFLFVAVSAAIAFMFVKALRVKPVEMSTQELFDEGERRARQGDWARALDMFNYVLRKDPSLPGAWNNKGTALYHLSRYNEALSAFEEALKLAPDNPDVLKNKGLVLVVMGNFAEALNCFESALKFSPDLDVAKKGRDLCLQKIGKREE